MSKRSNISLHKLITPDHLKEYAGEPSYWRGVQYVEEDRVIDLRLGDDRIRAAVRGTRRYRVELWEEEKSELGYSCTCPFCQDEGAFCKHCVAVGLAMLAQAGGVLQSSERGNVGSQGKNLPEQELTVKQIREFLGRQERSTLVSLLVKQAERDDRFKAQLAMRAGNEDRHVHIPTFRKAIDRAVNWGGYVDYHSMYDYVQGIEDVMNSLRDLLAGDHSAEVLELSEHFLRSVEVHMDSVDDSDGYMRDIISDLEDMHHGACLKLRPDPEQLARKLFTWGLQSDWEVFYNASESYADVLGDRGLSAFRALAEDRWGRMRTLKPGEEDLEYKKERFRITNIMEKLAEQSGDVEKLVAVKSKNLATAYAYLEIAELYRKSRKDSKALKWAEEGIRAFPEETDSRLREFLAEEYHRRGRHEDAMRLIWAEFLDHSGFEEYRGLKSHAVKAGGSKSWKVWREKALEFLRRGDRAKEQEAKRKRIRWFAPDRSTLVEIFLWENDTDQAWLEAQEGGCHESLWLKLAAAREDSHPEDAISVYKTFVDPAVRRMNNPSY